MKIFRCIFACIILASCSKGKPPGIIPPDKMEDVLWDQMRADAFTGFFLSKDSTKNLKKENSALQEKIFQKYHTDRESFYRSYNYYLDHGDQLRDMLDSMVAKQSRLREKERMKELIKRKKENEQNT